MRISEKYKYYEDIIKSNGAGAFTFGGVCKTVKRW